MLTVLCSENALPLESIWIVRCIQCECHMYKDNIQSRIIILVENHIWFGTIINLLTTLTYTFVLPTVYLLCIATVNPVQCLSKLMSIDMWNRLTSYSLSFFFYRKN